MTALSPESVEREYNLRAAFPDHPEWFARWAADSAAARRTLNGTLDLRYGSGPRQTLDLFPAAHPRAALMFIHGGYWRALDKQEHSFVAPPLVERGVGVAVINYDLCPDVSVSRITEQCREALLWLQREGARYAVPAKRIVVAGHSAGGHLAAMLFATDWAARGAAAGAIIGGAAISGVFDLEPLVQVSFNSALRLDTPRARALSPIHMTPKVHAPLLLAAGADETSEFIRQSCLLWERWPECRLRGSKGPMLVRDTHHYGVLSELGDPGSELVSQLLGLLGPADV
ncbi:MAG TPA: alpha/beta hydrolase [Casimicrobiaceae bacterium]|nr:alpha/beta hydrolase [Casimicrobiaceae bacterium]